MIANILVPHDGSALAERALPFATSLARAADARLWLVHARASAVPLLDPEHGLDPSAMIEGVAAHLRERGLKATARTMHGDAASVILDASVDMPADLIVMSTHGRGGIGRWLYGSVADQVLVRATVPVLLVPAACDHPWPDDRRLKILVPLDGSDLSEAAVGPARVLGRAIGADLLLLRVAEQGADVVWGINRAVVPTLHVTPEELGEVRQYLDGIAAPPGALAGSTDVLVESGDPSSVIPRIARQEGIDLIAMATHGRTGLARLTMGSVATVTVQRAHIPVLLVRPPGLERPMDDPSPAPKEAEPPDVWPPIGTR
jgi:nucleotide-binding universal stress UspA family protein